MTDPLSGTGYPALHAVANAASLAAQRRFLLGLRIRLGGLLAGAIGGAVFLSIGLGLLGGWMAVVGFAAAILTELFLALDRADRKWYEGRAAAESVKTLAWRYAVRGESSGESTTSDETDRMFLGRVKEVLDDLKEIELIAPNSASSQITDEMRRLRARDFAMRKAAYRDGRIEEQREWYSQKAQWNELRRVWWLVGIITAEGVGLVLGVVVIVGGVDIDLLGLVAAMVATATAWSQAKQYSNLATAYGIAAQELASVKGELDMVPEDKWAAFVGSAEEAVSREHTLWRASRGLSIATRSS